MLAELKLFKGDITRQSVDAIVNAANSRLAGGGGVDGAIHRAGGPAIMAACDEIRRKSGGCPTGTAVVTTAGRLEAKAVIHTAGPRWKGGDAGESERLASSYASCLQLAAMHGFRTLAFPSISTGVYGYPIAQAADIALSTVAAALTEKRGVFDEVRFVLFSQADLQIYRTARERLRV